MSKVDGSGKRAKTGGRKKGTPNKISGTLREMILGALDGMGGQKYLEAQAQENPTAFLALLGKVLPMQIAADVRVEPDDDSRALARAERLEKLAAGYEAQQRTPSLK